MAKKEMPPRSPTRIPNPRKPWSQIDSCDWPLATRLRSSLSVSTAFMLASEQMSSSTTSALGYTQATTWRVRPGDALRRHVTRYAWYAWTNQAFVRSRCVAKRRRMTANYVVLNDYRDPPELRIAGLAKPHEGIE